MPSGGAAVFAIAFMAAGCFLTVIFFVGLALVVVGHFKPSRKMRRAGWIVLVIWLTPAALWLYQLAVLTEHDQYRTLAKPEVVYGVPLPAGAQVNYHRWARRVQWATFTTPQVIEGIEYTGQVNFCGHRVCSGTLTHDQEIQGLLCAAQTEVQFAESDGRLNVCTLSRSFLRQGVNWPPGTMIRTGTDPNDSYLLPDGAAPVPVKGLLVHSGLIVWLTREGQIAEIDRNQSRAGADTVLEAGDVSLRSEAYLFGPDGMIRGGVLVRPAIIGGKHLEAGQSVVIPQPAAH